eukprot:jgi/Astpho2/6098/e_gw1.00084.76.1_t
MLHQPQQPVLEPPKISAGDLVVVYEGFNAMKAVQVEPTMQFGTKFGQFPMKDWVGRRYGCKVTAKLGKNTAWLLLLRPTPELWTQVLKHRTQILYVADISLLCMHLELRPGCTVLESGTGSGSLTHSLARAVAPTGHVHSFEFHEERATMAAREFDSNGLGDLVTVQQRNIEELGFPEELHEQADALFLDLPRPWMAVPSAARCLRPDGAFCSFSPCIEQVQKTCAKLEEEGFFCVRTIECLLRAYEVKQEKLRTDLEPREAAPRAQGQKGQKRKRVGLKFSPEPAVPQQSCMAKPVLSARGHTGYLTLARRHVNWMETANEDSTLRQTLR